MRKGFFKLTMKMLLLCICTALLFYIRGAAAEGDGEEQQTGQGTDADQQSGRKTGADRQAAQQAELRQREAWRRTT